ncbi:MAG TPA: aspartate/glutamate racemase family protein [Caulobacteraceae bacterium]
MKTLGLLGGMSWESTATYYQMLNRMTRERLGGSHSASIILWSVDFEPITRMQSEGRWDEAQAILVDAARRLEQAGAEALMICANTMHRMADEVQAAVGIPLIHIADATAAAVKAAGVRRPMLLGTRYTMEEAFYRDRMTSLGVEVAIPGEVDRARLQRMIYEELVRGIINPQSKFALLQIVGAERAAGADGVILGCTELDMLVGEGDIRIPTFNSTELHARAGLDFALGNG